MAAQTNHQLTKVCCKNKLTRWFVYEWRKPTQQKPYQVILRSPLGTLYQYLIPVPYTNLQLNPYPNTQLDLFCSDNLSFQCTSPSMWLTNCVDPNTRLQSPTREGCWLQSPSVHHTMKIEKLLGYKTLRCTNTAASSQERWTRANFVFDHNLPKQNFAQHLGNLCHLWRPLK